MSFSQQTFAQVELRHDLMTQSAQGADLFRSQLPRLVVDDAQRAQGVALGRHQGRSRVEADAGGRGHQRIVCEALVGAGVGHDEHVRLQDGMSAERHLAGRLLGRKPHPRFEPLTTFIDEADQGNRRLTDVGCQGAQLVVRRFGRRIQNVEPAQGGQPFHFVRGQRSIHRLFPVAGFCLQG
jgi:hypothetical protein